MLSCFSRVLTATPWTVARQALSTGILQARILEWAAISSSRGSSRPGDRTRVSCTSCAGRWILDHPGSPNSHVEASVSHRGGCSLWPMDQTVPAACFCTALELRMVSTYLKVVKSRERRAHGPQASSRCLLGLPSKGSWAPGSGRPPSRAPPFLLQ